MKIGGIEFNENQPEQPHMLSALDRRAFFKLGFVVTGAFLGGTVLSLASVANRAFTSPEEHAKQYPYKPHYSMLIYQNRCIDCERCLDACAKTNHVPKYGYRTAILEREAPNATSGVKREFIPVLCNHCNRPPCVRACPTTATYKNEKNGIVMMESKKCIGCKTCIAACPYNARYFNEERRAVDKCDFCFASRLSRGLKDTACVEACPAKARIFGDLSDPASEVYRMVHQIEKTVWVMRPETGAAPNVFYTRA